MDEKKPRYGLSPFRIACIYAVIGGLWILFSDTILAWIAADPATFIRLSIYKGWAFILITAALLYWLVHRYVAEQQAILIAENESRQYNRALFERSPIGLALCRMDGSLVDVNEAYARMIGRTVEETLTLSYWDITPKQYTEQEQVQLDSIRRTGKFGPYEKEYIHKDGRLVPVTLQGLIIERRGEQLICASVEDITERKKGEDIIRTVNEELMTINRIVQACSSTLDQKEILNIAMDEALQITGLEGGTICKVTPEDTLLLAVHRETSDATIQDLATNTIKVGDCLCGECARDLKPLILRDRQAVLNYATREATRGEDIRFHAAFPIIVKNRCLGVLCVFTRTDNKPSDRSLALLETVTVQIALALENAQLYEEAVRYAAALEDRVRERTAELENKSGELQNSQKALVNIVEDLHRKSHELEQANVILKEVDRLKSLFIASMSHELRTPLNSIIGFSSILLYEWVGTLNKEQKEHVSTVLRSGEHLLALINDVIDVSKIEAGTIDVRAEDFDLHDVISEAAGLVEKDMAAKGIEFIVQNLHQPMHTDRRRLLQCIINLVSNGMKFTERGSVRVQARLSAKRGMRNAELTERKYPEPDDDLDHIEIIVEDTGIGISKEDLPKLFNSFVRLDSPLRSTVSGTGLGLYIMKKIATEVLKGEVFVTSQVNRGSRFAILIPVRT